MAKKRRKSAPRRSAPQNIYRPPDYAAPQQAAQAAPIGGPKPAQRVEKRSKRPQKRRPPPRPRPLPSYAAPQTPPPGATYHSRRREQRRRYIKPIGSNTVDLLYRGLVIAAIVAIALFTLSVFFGVQEIEVVDSQHYLSSEIAKASGIEAGDKLMLINRGKAAESIITKLPYVKAVRIRTRLPGTVTIEVTERKPAAALVIGGFEYIIDSECSLLEISALRGRFDLPLISCEAPVEPVAGQPLVFSNELLRSTLCDILGYIADTSYMSKISEINAERVYDVSFLYEGRLTVRLGDTGELDKKLLMLNEVLTRLEDDAAGNIDLRNPNSVRYMKK